MVPTPDIQGGSSNVFSDPSTNSVSNWNANEMIIIASIVKTLLDSKGSNGAEIIMIISIVELKVFE